MEFYIYLNCVSDLWDRIVWVFSFWIEKYSRNRKKWNILHFLSICDIVTDLFLFWMNNQLINRLTSRNLNWLLMYSDSFIRFVSYILELINALAHPLGCVPALTSLLPVWECLSRSYPCRSAANFPVLRFRIFEWNPNFLLQSWLHFVVETHLQEQPSLVICHRTRYSWKFWKQSLHSVVRAGVSRTIWLKRMRYDFNNRSDILKFAAKVNRSLPECHSPTELEFAINVVILANAQGDPSILNNSWLFDHIDHINCIFQKCHLNKSNN